MTTFDASTATAFSEGLHREQGLFGERDGWTRERWVARKVFLEDMIDREVAAGAERGEKARLQGRLMAVCLEGLTRFGE